MEAQRDDSDVIGVGEGEGEAAAQKLMADESGRDMFLHTPFFF